jgi:hypothetical protein
LRRFRLHLIPFTANNSARVVLIPQAAPVSRTRRGDAESSLPLAVLFLRVQLEDQDARSPLGGVPR